MLEAQSDATVKRVIFVDLLVLKNIIYSLLMRKFDNCIEFIKQSCLINSTTISTDFDKIMQNSVMFRHST